MNIYYLFNLLNFSVNFVQPSIGVNLKGKIISFLRSQVPHKYISVGLSVGDLSFRLLSRLLNMNLPILNATSSDTFKRRIAPAVRNCH